jgi:hypothetical protein
MRKVGVITAWNDDKYEWSYGYRPLTYAVLQSDPEVLCAPVIISVINGNLVRMSAIILGGDDGQAKTRAQAIGNAVLN